MSKRDQLLVEILGGDQGERFARLAAAGIRRRRALRRLGGATAVAAAVFAAILLVHRPAQPVRVPTPVANVVPAYEIISDQELLVQLKDEPVLVLRDQTGITGVIFLPRETPARL